MHGRTSAVWESPWACGPRAMYVNPWLQPSVWSIPDPNQGLCSLTLVHILLLPRLNVSVAQDIHWPTPQCTLACTVRCTRVRWSCTVIDLCIIHCRASVTALRARNYKRNLLVRGTSRPKIYLSKCLHSCPDLLATDQLNYQLIPHNFSWGQASFKSTCPPPFLFVPDNRTICFFEPCALLLVITVYTAATLFWPQYTCSIHCTILQVL